MRVAAGIVLLVVSCGSPQPSGDAVASPARNQPVFTIGVWPGEGIPVIEAASDRVLLRAAPSDDARVTDTLTLTGSKRLTYDSTRVQTLAPSRLSVVEPITLTGRVFVPTRFLSREEYYGAARDTSIMLARGDTLSHLQDRAEGSCIISLGGNVIEAGTCPTFDTTAVRRSGRPLTAWWIHVSMNGKRGWVLVSESTARVIDRTF